MDSSSTQQSLGTVSKANVVAETPPAVEAGDLGLYVIFKRLIDLLLSFVLLIVLLPLLLLLALVVRIDSLGPVIFKQPRVGKHGELFVLYKFRTMAPDAPTLTTEEMKKSGRSYYTNLGAMLRRFSLDELPQLINVFRGDMSLIGPRPSLSTQDWLNTRRSLCRVYDLRPGITGWAQVMGRDELTDAEKVAYDAEYRKRCSLLLDIKIAFMTVKAVFSGDGAR